MGAPRFRQGRSLGRTTTGEPNMRPDKLSGTVFLTKPLTPEQQRFTVEVANRFGNKPTISHKEVISLCEETGVKFPYWLVSKYSVKRGIYKNPVNFVVITSEKGEEE